MKSQDDIVNPANLVDLAAFKQEMQHELNAIIDYWQQFAIDPSGGFYGRIDDKNNPDPLAPKGVVLNSRILWAFSTATKFTAHSACLPLATRAFEYITAHFIDRQEGGVYWTVNHSGNPLDTKKQVYGLAFCIYGMAAFYSITKNAAALEIARQLYDAIELHSRDHEKGGYLEAFNRDWSLLADLRLSSKDRNEKKTMNTHLHILEAYAQLYKVWPDEKLRSDIQSLIGNFRDHMINPSGHLDLFFDEDWQVKGDIISYGHDIEASWLLLEAAETIQDESLIPILKVNALRMAQATKEGLDADGGLWYEIENGHLVKQKHSWPQAEAMVGFFNAAEVSGNAYFIRLSKNSWDFTRKYIVDSVNGEWHWGIEENHHPMKGMDKAGIWKCPYHNSRACMEIIRRIENRSL